MESKQWFLIENKREFDLATRRYFQVREAEKGTIEHKEKLLLSLLISTYERQNSTLPDVDPVEMIKIRLEDLNLRAADLGYVYGHSGNVSKVLSYERSLSKEMVRHFSEILRIPAEFLLKPYDLKPRAQAGN